MVAGTIELPVDSSLRVARLKAPQFIGQDSTSDRFHCIIVHLFLEGNGIAGAAGLKKTGTPRGSELRGNPI